MYSNYGPNKRRPGPPPTLNSGGSHYSDPYSTSRPGQAFTVPTPYGRGPDERGYPKPSTVTADNFHHAQPQPPPSTSQWNRRPEYHRNSQSHAGNGFPYGDRGVFALDDDHNLSPADMCRPPANASEAGFRHAALVDRAMDVRSRVRGAQAAQPIESPSKARRKEEKERKDRLDRQSRAEAEEEAAAKRRQARDSEQQLKQARQKSEASSSANIPRPGALVDKLVAKLPSSKRTSSASAGVPKPAAPSKLPVIDEFSKKKKEKKKRPVQIDVSDESGGEDERKSSRRRDDARSESKGKSRQREAKKPSRLGGTRRAGFDDDNGGDSDSGPSVAAHRPLLKKKRAKRLPASSESPVREPSPEKATPLLDLFKEKEDGNVTLSDSSDDEDTLERLRESRARADSRFDSPYPDFDPTQAPVNPDTLCPFCDQPLPDNPSEDLLRKKDALLNDPSARRKRTMQNSKAVRLRDGHVVRTAEFCKQHRDERIFIPEGRAQGWPAEIDWAALPGRIERLLGVHLNNIVLGKVETPFLERAHSDFARVGGKRGNAVNDLATFGVEEPGYYGPKGRKVICDAVTHLLTVTFPLLTPHRVEPLDVDFYVRRVLLPECAIELVRDDLGGSATVSRERAEQTVQDSRGYGKAMFPDVGDGEERGMTQAPVDVDIDESTSSSDIEVEEVESVPDRTGTTSSQQSRKRKTLHVSSDNDDDDEGSVSDSHDAIATSSKSKAPSVAAPAKQGGLRMPKSFGGAGSKPSSSGSSTSAATSSRTSKASHSTGITIPDAEASEDEDLRPPPSAQHPSAKSAKSSLFASVTTPAKTGGLLDGMPSSSAIELSDSETSNDSDASLDEVVETGLAKRKRKEGRTRGRKQPSPLKREKKKKKAPKSPKQKVDQRSRSKSPQKKKRKKYAQSGGSSE
ncbi:hypothetical protein B0A53_01604 [Rhodotorula sp. CCFEE 5036]|nr:hypothetical protein B0A53_01604 [Rhodotorula sp. CCFEE 5036]